MLYNNFLNVVQQKKKTSLEDWQKGKKEVKYK